MFHIEIFSFPHPLSKTNMKISPLTSCSSPESAGGIGLQFFSSGFLFIFNLSSTLPFHQILFSPSSSTNSLLNPMVSFQFSTENHLQRLKVFITSPLQSLSASSGLTYLLDFSLFICHSHLVSGCLPFSSPTSNY